MSDGYFISTTAMQPLVHLRETCRQLGRTQKTVKLTGLPPGAHICGTCLKYQKTMEGLAVWQAYGRPV